jgi:hypothetical protein
VISRREFISRSLRAGVGLAAAEMTYATFLARCGRASSVIGSDNFTRANANPISGQWATAGSPPGEPLSPLQIVSNSARPTASPTNFASSSYWTGQPFPSTCYTEFIFGAKNSNTTGFLFCGAAPGLGSGYGLLVNGTYGAGAAIGQLRLANGNATSPPNIAFFFTLTLGDIIRLSYQAGVLSFLQNGVVLSTNSDNTYRGFTNAGVCGIQLTADVSLSDISVTQWAAGIEGDFRNLQVVPFGQDDGTTSESGIFPNDNQQGNLLLCLVGSNIDSPSISVDDTQGNIWQQTPAKFVNPPFWGWLFYAANCRGGPNTVTAHLPGGGQHIVGTLGEYNFKNAVLVDSASSTGLTANPSATVHATAGDLLIGFMSCAPSGKIICGINGACNRGGGPSNFDEIRLLDQTAITTGNNTMTGQVGAINGADLNPQVCAAIVASFSGAASFGGSRILRPTAIAKPSKVL